MTRVPCFFFSLAMSVRFLGTERLKRYSVDRLLVSGDVMAGKKYIYHAALPVLLRKGL